MSDINDMNDLSELRALLESSGMPFERRVYLITSVLGVATKNALDQSKGQAGGDFLRILIELIKILLPILLELFRPKA